MPVQVPERILVVVPTYNEADNINPLAAGVGKFAPEVDLLFVDDNSRDATPSLIRQLMSTRPGKIFLLERERKLGLGTAYITAFKWAIERNYDAVVEMDADLSHRPEDLAKLVDALKSAPVVIGSRYIPGGGTENWSWTRRLISRGGSLYARTILGLSVRDLTGGFNGWHKEVLERIGLNQVASEGYTFQVELKYRAALAGFPLKEIPILFVERRAGQSKMSGGIIYEAIYRVWSLALQRKAILAQRAIR